MLDLAVKLQMLQERYKSNAEQGYISALKDAHERIVGKLASTDGVDQIKRLKAIRALIEDEIGQLYESVKPDLKDDMQGFAELEHKTLFNYMNETNGLGYAFVALPKDTIKEVLDFDAVIEMGGKGYSVNDFFDTASQAHINRYKQIIAGGLASNDGYRAITKRLKEADATGTMQLSSIVHTAISAARDRANVKTYETFDDVIIGWKSIATLDSRVSAVCASMDGVTYMKPKFKRYEDIPNRPPRHPRCRSIIRSLTKLDEEGLRPQNGDTKGQISSDTKFPDWFANQSKDFQRKWLGESRYQLYKDGRLAIKDFVDVKSGRLFTLDEIKAEMGGSSGYISAFMRSKIDRKIKSIEASRIDMINNYGYTNDDFEKYLLTSSERKMLKGDYSDFIKQYEEQEKNAKEVESIFVSKTSKSFKSIFNKYGHANEYTFSDSDDIAFLSSGSDITISKTVDYRVFKHEYGHFVDAQMGNRSMGNDFIEAFYKDSKLKQNGFYYDTDDFDSWLSSTLHDASRTEKFSDFSSAQIADIIDAMNDGKPSSGGGLFGFSGHGEEYFAGEHGESLKLAEAFAELFEMKDTDDYVKLKDHFPNMVEVFDRIYKEEILK